MKEEIEIKSGQVWVIKGEYDKPVMITKIGEFAEYRWFFDDEECFESRTALDFANRFEFVTDCMTEEDFKEWCKTGENPTLKSETETKSVDENILQPSADGEKGYLVTQKLQYAATNDPVHHPSHYTSHPSGIECIEITRHMSFNIGNAIKYLWRNGKKDGQPAIQDLQKAVWYIQDEIRRLSK